MRSLLLITLLGLSFLSTGYSQTEKQFGSIVIRNGDFGTVLHYGFLIDFDCTFAWMSGESHDFGTNATPGVFVYSKSLDRWLQIAKVSAAGAKFGKSSQLVQAPWDFTGLSSKEFAPLPILSLVPHYPDEVSFDETQSAFVLHFDSRCTVESERTTLLIPKKDLTEAFEYYSKPKTKGVAEAASANPFPVNPPITDADPSVRHSIPVRVPTVILVVRHGDSLAPSFPMFETTNLMVGHKMVTGIMRVDSVSSKGITHQRGMSLQGGLAFESDTNVLTFGKDGIPQPGQNFTLEHQVTIFETDLPAQHMWSPQSGKHYRVLWTRTFREAVK